MGTQQHVGPRTLLSAAGSTELDVRIPARAAQSPSGRLGTPALNPLQFPPSPLLPCPGQVVALPATDFPLGSGAASSPFPLGPTPNPRLRLRVTILVPTVFISNSCGLHVPAAPAALSCDLSLTHSFGQRMPRTTTPSKSCGGLGRLLLRQCAFPAAGPGRGVCSLLGAGTALGPPGPARRGRGSG